MAKEPQDHLAKKTDPDDYFTFIVASEPYTMPTKTADVVTAGFIRANRRREEVDYALTVVEELAGDSSEGRAILKVFDRMTRDEFVQFQKDFVEHLGATLGE